MTDPNIQELLRRWTPISLLQLPEEVETPPIFTDYVGKEDKPYRVGCIKGLLRVVGYSHVPLHPYAVKCKCGNILYMSKREMTRMHCGCFDQITRTAYLIRLRIETLRSWWAQMNYWLDDMHTLTEYAKHYRITFKEHTRGCLKARNCDPKFIRIQHSKNPLVFDRKVEPEPKDAEAEADMFLSLIAPNPEYEQFLRDTAESLTKTYEPWPAIPMASASAYYSYRDELPEFDATTFINFVNYLIDMEKNPGKTSGNKSDEPTN